MIDQIHSALAAEFALPSAYDMTVMISRLLTALVLGAVLGLERESKGRAAGLKTHMLVSVGSALFVLAPLQMGVDPADVTRVMQGIVSGIGFLGAGAIIRTDKGEHVEGLTTAAGIWMTSAIGMAAGMGREMAALITTVLALLVFLLIPLLARNGKHEDDNR